MSGILVVENDRSTRQLLAETLKTAPDLKRIDIKPCPSKFTTARHGSSEEGRAVSCLPTP